MAAACLSRLSRIGFVREENASPCCGQGDRRVLEPGELVLADGSREDLAAAGDAGEELAKETVPGNAFPRLGSPVERSLVALAIVLGIPLFQEWIRWYRRRPRACR